MKFYLDNLSADKHELHLLYWNRDEKPEPNTLPKGVVLHEFSKFQEEYVPKYQKLGSFLGYRRYAKRLLKQETFDFIIVLHSLPGVLLSGMLKRRYKGRYIFDYRDLTYEAFLPYRKVIHRLVKDSYATFVSSNGFRPFLPMACTDKIYTSHNFMMESLAQRDALEITSKEAPIIRIAYWGFIRDEWVNCRLIDRLGRDNRFELHYYGKESRVTRSLQTYALTIGADHVFFHGEYTPEQRYDFAQKTEIIHNMFGDKNMMVAMSNKYYDGVIFHIPQLCMPGSVMGKRAETAGIGFCCDPLQEDFADRVYEYYHTLDRGSFCASCNKEMSRILSEYEQGCQVIRRAVSD